jgi:hypothetical protein
MTDVKVKFKELYDSPPSTSSNEFDLILGDIGHCEYFRIGDGVNNMGNPLKFINFHYGDFTDVVYCFMEYYKNEPKFPPNANPTEIYLTNFQACPMLIVRRIGKDYTFNHYFTTLDLEEIITALEDKLGVSIRL